MVRKSGSWLRSNAGVSIPTPHSDTGAGPSHSRCLPDAQTPQLNSHAAARLMLSQGASGQKRKCSCVGQEVPPHADLHRDRTLLVKKGRGKAGFSPQELNRGDKFKEAKQESPKTYQVSFEVLRDDFYKHWLCW